MHSGFDSSSTESKPTTCHMHMHVPALEAFNHASAGECPCPCPCPCTWAGAQAHLLQQQVELRVRRGIDGDLSSRMSGYSQRGAPTTAVQTGSATTRGTLAGAYIGGSSGEAPTSKSGTKMLSSISEKVRSTRLDW